MLRKFMFLVIGLFFGTGFGFMLAVSSEAELSGHDHGAGADHSGSEMALHDHAQHDHSTLLDVPTDMPAPSISVVLHPDTASGHNLQIITENFRFTPEAVNREHVAGEGHAHIYVNGQKLMRVYSSWTHLADLPKGDFELSVSLNANTHSPLSVGGVPLRVTTKVTVN